MRRREGEPLPDTLKSELKMFVRIMYLRFEFARAADRDMLEEYLGEMTPQGYDAARGFQRILGRKSFLPGVGHPTYLADLKEDVASAGKQREQAIGALKAFVEDTRCPLTHHLPATYERYLDPFFPRPEDLTSDTALRDYCYSLFELQDYFQNVVGVEPGSLLPVWVSKEPKNKKDIPLLGILPVRRSLVETLVAYVMWEYGFSFADEPLPGDRRRKEFLYDMVYWGRVDVRRYIDEDAIVDNADRNLTDEDFRKYSRIRQVVASIPERYGVSGYPETMEKEVRQGTDRLPADHPQKGEDESPETLRKRAESAGDKGSHYIAGAYKDLW